MSFAIRTIACLAIAMAVAGCGRAPVVSNVRLLDYGLYQGEAKIVTSSEAGRAPEVVTITVKGQPEPTTKIPCKPNILFGYRLDPNTLPSSCQLRLEYEHPAFDGQEGQATEVEELEIKAREEFDGEIIYCFHESAPQEIVPGTWTFRVVINGKLAAEKSFEVVK